MVSSKSIQKVNEFCKEGNLEEYREILQDIFQKIENANCRITARYDSDFSVHEENNGKCLIRISLRNNNVVPINILWTIFHEFGHHISGTIEKKDENDFNKKILSEKNAWRNAKIEVLKYPSLNCRIDEFEKFRNECLETYVNYKTSLL